MEMDVDGRLELFGETSASASSGPDRRQVQALPLLRPVDWKGRFRLFRCEGPTFAAPFHSGSITNVAHADEVVYCRCRLRTDALSKIERHGLYVEFQVLENTDNLSLAVVDFEAGGRSSVTFSPETGAVLRERKVRELPRAIEGSYLHVLPAAAPGHCFVGHMGMYLLDGHLAFFRRWKGKSDGETPWETTGFVTDLHWAKGDRLSVCLAFRDEGPYHVHLTGIGTTPPMVPERSRVAYRNECWGLLYGDEDNPPVI